MVTAPLRYSPCSACHGDGCPACDGAGFFPTATADYTPTILHRPAVLAHAGPLLLCSARDGWATADRGTASEWRYPRWALCASSDGRVPLRKYRNGGPVGLSKAVAGKVAPLWHTRAIGFVASCGGLPMAALPMVAEWFRSNRVGAPDLADVETWGTT